MTAETKPKKPRVKKPPAPKIDRSDWRYLSYDKWNVRTFHAYFADMNAKLYGADKYLPMRNWGFEQGAIKHALTEHGAELLRLAFDECFHDYRPTRDYPILTAGFALSYRVNGIIPRLKAEQAERERLAAEKERVESVTIDHAELEAWW